MNKSILALWIKKPFRGSTLGLSIVEVLVAVAILGIVTFFITNFLSDVMQNRNRIESISARDAIGMRIKRVISRNNIQFSATNFSDGGNLLLRNCLDNDTTTICQTTNLNRPESFRLGYPRGGTATQVAGTETSPLLYQRNGGVCLPGGNCRGDWEARTYFTAICPNQAATCPQAMAIRVRFQLRHVPELGQRAIPSLPTDTAFADRRLGNIVVKIFDPFQVSACPPFSVVRDVKSTGEPVCVCQAGATPNGTQNGQPVCVPGELRCRDNLTERLYGFDQNMQPLCTPRARFNCRTVPSSTDCGGIVRAVELGACRVVENPTKKKGTNTTDIVCDEDRYTCCTAQ